MPEDDHATPLSPGVLLIAARAAEIARRAQQPLSVHHWLAAVLERYGPMVADLASVNPSATLERTRSALADGNLGQELPQEDLFQRALALSAQRGAQRAAERDVVEAIFALIDGDISSLTQAPTTERATPTNTTAGSSAEGHQHRKADLMVAATPTLDKFGRDLTAEAQRGNLLPVVGRDDETALVIETLSRRTKRNPALVGPAGVGKTAIAEGLAQRITAGNVPEHLQGCRVIAVQPSNLTAGASLAGELERRMQAILEEARQPGIILFIDEVHSLIGAGGRAGTTDAASLLKPALARGDIACIAATTDEEYRRWIEADGALERRFQPIRVQELSREQAAVVLASVRDDLSRLRGVAVPDNVLDWLLTASIRYLRNRYLPDKAIDLLEQTVAHCVTVGRTGADVDVARFVTERMVGMPLDGTERLEGLAKSIVSRGLMREEDAETLVARLRVTMRGLDIRPSRPNAVMLLAGEASNSARELCELLARDLFGAEERVVGIDLGPMVNDEDVTRLLGASAGYVGYDEHLPLHDVRQMPWCVLRFDAIHACHPAIREVVIRALVDGFFTDAQGRRVFLSDAVVVLTANVPLVDNHPIGFGAQATERHNRIRDEVARAFGDNLADQCDILCDHLPQTEASANDSARELVDALGERYRSRGLEVHWDPSFLQWVCECRCRFSNERDWECFLDENLAPRLLEHVDRCAADAPRSVIVACHDGGVTVVET